MFISITAKDKDTFSVTVKTTSTTTHTVTISDQIHSKLTGGEISKETLLKNPLSSCFRENPTRLFFRSSSLKQSPNISLIMLSKLQRGSSTLEGLSIMSTIQGTSTINFLAAHMKEQARSMSIDPKKEDEKDPLMEATKGVVVSLSHDAKQALLKDVMK